MIKSILHSLSGDIWEVRTTGVTNPDVPTDPKQRATIKVRLYGMFSFITEERFHMPGIAKDADAVLGTVSNIDEDSQIEVDDVRYEIVGKASGKGWAQSIYTYYLKRVKNLPA